MTPRGADRRSPLSWRLFLICAGTVVCVATLQSPALPVDSSDQGKIRRLLTEGSYTGARQRAAAHLDRVRAADGPDALSTAHALDLLVEARLADGDRTLDLLALAQSAFELNEKLLGAEDLRLADSLTNLARAEKEIRGDRTRTRERLERALALRRKHLGEDHEDTLMAVVLLAATLRDEGEFGEARSLLERGCDVAESAFGPESLILSRLLGARGTLLRRLDELEGARPDVERAVRIQEKLLGTHPEFALTLNRLAVLEWAEGNFVEARVLYDRQLEIQKLTLRPGHPDFGTTWLNIGLLLWSAGDLPGAKELFDRSRALAAHFESPNHPDRGYQNYARLAMEMGDHTEALALMEKLQNLREKLLPPNDPLIAGIYWDLGTLHRETGDLRKSREYLERALTLSAGVHGTRHTRYAEILRDLALLDERTGDLSTARLRLQRAIEIAEAALGREHPMTALFLGDLGRLLWRQGESAAALRYSLEAAALHRKHLARVARYFSEREILSAESHRLSAIQVACSILARTEARNEIAARVWDEVTRGRALVLDAIAARHRVALDADGGAVAALRGKLEGARRRLAHLFLRGPGQGDVEEYVRRVDTARDEKEDLERRLAETGEASGDRTASREVGLDAVHASLPGGAALVAFVELDDLPAPSLGTVAAGAVPEPVSRRSYLGLVLAPGREQPAIVPLGDAVEAERAVEVWRAEAAARPRNVADTQRYLEAGRRLREIVWDPIARQVVGAEQVFVVPEGALHLVSLATLPDGGGKYLVEKVRFHYLSSERDIVALAAPEPPGRGLLVLGGANFDTKPGAPSTEIASDRSVPSYHRTETYRGIRPACEDFQSLRFSPLPGSEAEARELATAYRSARGAAANRDVEPVTILAGAEAGEGAFKRLAPGHRILHLATHAFLINADCGSGASRPAARDETARGATAVRAVFENPLLLGGIAFTAANRRNEASLEQEDGVLTAEEAASLDLRGVEWAVLSGCETGLGLVQTGEGVLGLRRAFRVAGARTLLLSLWPVEDHAARQWFRHLYAARLGGDPTPVAMQRASLEVLEHRRASGVTTHPFFWGAFVAAGDWN